MSGTPSLDSLKPTLNVLMKVFVKAAFVKAAMAAGTIANELDTPREVCTTDLSRPLFLFGV